MITNNVNAINYTNQQKIKTDDITEYVTHNFEDDDFKYTVEVDEDLTYIRYYDWNEETHKWEKHDELELPSNMAYLIAQAIIKDVEAINGVIPTSVIYRDLTQSIPCDSPYTVTLNDTINTPSNTIATARTPDTSTIKRA